MANAAAIIIADSSDFGEVPHANAPQLTSHDWTAEFWVWKTSYLVDRDTPFCRSDVNNGDSPYYCRFNFNTFEYGYSSGFVFYLDSYDISGLSTSAWHHFAITYTNSTKVLRLYIDGSIVKTGSAQAATNSTCHASPLNIGGDGSNALPLTGKLDELRLWDVVRTGVEIAAYYDKKAIGTESGLVACWSMEEGAGTSAANSVAGGTAITWTGSPAWETSDLPTTDSPVTLVREQEGYRFRADDGDEDGATWLASQDTNISRAKLTNTRLRLLTNYTGDPPSEAPKLQVRRANGADEWKDVD